VSTRRLFAAVALASFGVLVVGSVPRAAAVSFTLTEPQKQAAIAFGTRSITQTAFDAEWSVPNGNGERVVVLSPFHRLALAARHAAFRNQPLKPGEPERLLTQQRERFVLLVELRGPRDDFARYYVPELQVGGQTVKAAFVQNERSALKQDGDRYLARCRYEFPLKDVGSATRVSLVVRDLEGRETSAFAIDLSGMR
jgi:hypothetical protein